MVRCTLLERRDGAAVLLSAGARRQAVYQSSRLRASGLRLIDAPAVLLDAQTSEAVVPACDLPLAADALVPSVAQSVEQVTASVAERRFPIAAWVFLSLPGELEPVSRAMALTRASTALLSERPPRRATIRELADILRRTTPLAAGAFTSLELLPRLADWAE